MIPMGGKQTVEGISPRSSAFPPSSPAEYPAILPFYYVALGGLKPAELRAGALEYSLNHCSSLNLPR